MKKKPQDLLDLVNDAKIKRKFSDNIYQIGYFIIGSLLYGAAMNIFLKPAGIVLGGITGISTTLNYLFSTPIGLGIIVINIPIIIISWRIFGLRAIINTILGILGTSIAVDTMTFLPVTITDPLLCSVFGGLCLGAGTGTLFARGYTTGGSDLISLILKRKFRQMSTGKLIMILDLVVITSAALITRRLEGIFYSLIATYAYMTMIDLVLGGAEKAKLVYVISPKYQIIANDIFTQLGRAVTVLYGRGWYTKEDKCILMCVVKKNELYKMKVLIHSVDPGAFVIFSEATEVMGFGFKSEV